MRRRPTLSRSTLATALVVAFAAFSLPADPAGAAGLGRLSVQSHLGQPLRAEVEITSLSAQEAQTLTARLAPAEAFQAAGLQYNPALGGLRLSIEPRAGRTFLRLVSAQPLNEPFVDLLLELSWAGGKLLREYTFLLDPPPEAARPARSAGTEGSAAVATVPGSANPTAAAPPATAATVGTTAGSGAAPGSDASATAAPRVSGPAPKAETPVRSEGAGRERAPAASPPDRRAPDRVEVVRGETLSGIAQRLKPSDASLDQAMWAIFSANQAAFGGNINVLRQGAVLAIPDANSMVALPPEEARRQVRMQTADFAAYRRQLAASAPATAGAPAAGASASGAVSGRVIEGAAPSAQADRLQLSRPEVGAGPSGEALGRSAPSGRSPSVSAEQLVAKDAALREAQSRLEALERNVDDLKRLLELRGRAMADLQSQLEDAREAVKTATGRVGESSASKPAAPASAPAAAPAEPSAGSSVPAPAAAGTTPATSPASSDTAVAATPASPPAKPDGATAAPRAGEAPAVAAPNFLDDLLANPMLFPALGAVAALAGGYALYAIRRRRRVERFEDSLIAADALASNSLFGATGGQSVDTRQVTEALDGPASQVSTTEVDPVEEANVYVAYGREAQAEDILREGLRKEPNRQAIRHRLLELYAGRPDRAAFEALAREMRTMTDAQGDDWARVVQLGLSIDPDNPLYADPSARGPVASPLGGALTPPTASTIGATLALASGAVQAATETDTATGLSPLPDLNFPQEVTTANAGETDILITPPPDPTASDESTLPALDLSLDPPTAFADSAFSLPSGADADADAGATSEDLRARVPNLPDALDLDLDLAALEEISRIQVPTLLPRTAPSPADLGLDLDLENALNAPTDIAFGPTETETSRWQEMATKLDLAVAYREIGDDEGARELLQEVISGGDPEQQDKARSLLAQLA